MAQILRTAGERVAISSELDWVRSAIVEGAAEALVEAAAEDPTLKIRIEAEHDPFDTRGFELLARGAWSRRGEVVLENVCTSGFDLRISASSGPVFTYRWRPPRRERIAAFALRSRFQLLLRAVLMQYPALWWASTRGRAPLHASCCAIGSSIPMLVAHSGVGRSTVILREGEHGAVATGDNIAVGDGETLWGLVEPLRVEGGAGRKTTHDRREAPFPGRVESLVPNLMIALERSSLAQGRLVQRGHAATVRSIVTSTLAAGELRRYWSFAALLAAGTGLGPAEPPVRDVAERFASALPSYVLALDEAGTDLDRILARLEVAA
jgi:hypothetical protein